MSSISREQLREMNEALLVSSVHQHELIDMAERAEAAARASEERYRALFDLGPVAVYSCDASGVIREFNPRAAELWGREPALGDTDERFCGSFKLFRPDGSFMPHAQCPMAEVVSGKIPEVRNAEVLIERPDNSRVTVIVNVRPLRNERGEVTGAVNCFFDISERKDFERALRESEQRFRQLADTMPQIVWTARPDGHVDYYNERWYEFTGFPRDQFGQSSWEPILHPDDVQHCVDTYFGCVREGKPFEIEYRFKDRKSGGYRWFMGRALPVRNDVGEIVRWFGTCTDIDSQKQAENALDKAREQAETANRSKDRFLAVLSHELRTPLAPVLTTVQLMERDASLSDETRKAAGMIRRNIELEARLIDDLLDLTRISRGKLDLQITTVDVHQELRHALEMCDSEVRTRILRLTVHLEAKKHHVPGDVARLQQVLWNLLKNAVKFTPIGGGIQVSTNVTKAGRFRLTVKDTGVGIAPDALPKIFDAFEQGDLRTSRQFGGLGLGLSISKALVDLHGGTLTACSEGRGKGATFTLELPAVAPDAAAHSIKTPLPEHMKSIGGCRVLVVEDNDDTARAMAHLLSSAGYEVRTASTVAAALRVAGAERLDVVISDIGLPDGSGLDLMRQLTAKFAIKGIALSGYGMEEDVRRSKQAGFVEHITKPVDIARLEEIMRRLAVAAGCGETG